MKYLFPKGATSVILPVFIQDSTATDGSGLAGLDESSSIVGGYVRPGEVGLALAVDENVTTEGTYQSPTTDNQIRIGTPANGRPGVYELHIHDDLLASNTGGGPNSVLISLGGAANMADLVIEIQLTDFDLNDAVPDVNVAQISGSSAAADNLETLADGVEIFAPAYAGPRGPGVYLNDAAANTNTVNGVDGTWSNHVSTIAAAKTIADSLGTDRIYLVNNTNTALGAAMEDYEFVGIGEMTANVIDLSTQSADNSHFFNVILTGVQGGTGRLQATDCVLSAITSMELSALRCAMADGSALVLRNDCMFDSCWSTVAGLGTPILDINSVANVNVYFRHQSGGIQIDNAVATTVMSWEGIGQFIVGATCVSLNIVPRGVVTFTDNGTTTNLLTKDAAINLTNINVDGLGAATGGAINIEATGDNTIRDTIDNAAAVDKGGGLVGIPVTGHAFIAGREVTITGTTNYDASYEIISETTNEVVITASFVSETFAGSETINSSVKGIEFVGTITANTYLNTAHQDGVTHSMDDAGDVIDIVYIYAIGGGRTGTALSLVANLDGNSDELVVQAYNFVASAWETLEPLTGSGGSSFVALNPELLNRNTGTGADLADVFIRFATASTSPNSLDVDKLIVAAVNIGQSVGYANGRVWLDSVAGTAGTEAFVHGLGDNHSLTIADVLTLLASVGLKDIQVINGSTVVLGATVDNRSFFGDNWTLDLDGRSVTNAYFQGASAVSGICTASSEVHFEGCDFATATIQLGHFDFCGFAGTVTLDLAGDYNWHNCYSKVAGAGAPIFTKTAGQTITGEWRWYSGSITVSGIEAGDVFTISGELGTVTLNGAEGIVEIRGTYKNIVDNRTGTPTLNTDGAIKGVDVADTLGVLTTDTFALPGQVAPTATPTLTGALMQLYKVWRNYSEQDGAEGRYFDDAGTTVDQKRSINKTTGGIVEVGEVEAGP